jgi:two-component system CheB/CheR fusion protein
MRTVGVGASAGGLFALEQFFAKVPSPSGLAFVVVQHLDPTRKAALVALLQRVTPMPVREARSGMRITPDCVYVIPPNTELMVRDGLLQLDKPSEPRGLRLPIDVLFSSLARDQGSAGIGVVLSGMGADGSLGLQAIKAKGGLTLVQHPESARFDAMPRNAIATGGADIVALPGDMPAKILERTSTHRAAPPSKGAPLATETPPSSTTSQALQRIFVLLQKRTRHDFSLYKSSTLRRRIDRRMAIHGVTDLNDYVTLLQQSTQETKLLFKELLIGVTGFFRDAAAWRCIRDTALPALLARQTAPVKLRAWVAGCSTGEEAYTLAMTFVEALESHAHEHALQLQIFGSDLSADAIDRARTGVYPDTIRADVSPDRLSRFFIACDHGWRIKKEIRDMVLFAQHDVVLDPPFTRLDILCCRNLLIYFDASLQHRLMPLFHYSLRSQGILMLGSSETVGPFNQLFSPVDAARRR